MKMNQNEFTALQSVQQLIGKMNSHRPYLTYKFHSFQLKPRELFHIKTVNITPQMNLN